MHIRDDIFLILLLILFAGNMDPERFGSEERHEGLEGINSFLLIVLIFFLFNGAREEGRREECCGHEAHRNRRRGRFDNDEL